ncbi:ribonuclease H-like domain-containing protein [Tanacetum coccineum]
MELENSQNNALAKLPMLKLGDYEMWEIRIKQCFQIQDYALWEVIEYGNSWVPIPVTTSSEIGTSTATKMIMPSTIEEKTYKKNDVKARSRLLMTLPNEHQLTFDYDRPQYSNFITLNQRISLVHDDLEQLHDDDLEEMDLKWNMALLSMRARKFYQRTGRKIIIDGSNTVGYDKSKVECFNCHKMGHFARECRAPRSKDNRNWNQGSSIKAVTIEDASEKAMCAIDGAGFDWSDMAEEEIQANMALMAFSDSEVTNDKSCSKNCLKNYEALKKQYDDLLVKLSDTDFKAATYKRGLATLEGQIVKYREHEVRFSEEIALLKRSVGSKEYQMGLLRGELEMLREKVGFEFYDAKPTPLDLSYSGLEEFKEPEVNEYGPRDSSLKPTIGCDKESENSKENTDNSLEQHQITDTETSSIKSLLKVDKDWKETFFYPTNHVREVEPKKVKENNGAAFNVDWVSDDEDDDKPNPKVEKKTVIPTATKKEFVKPVCYNGRPFSTDGLFNTVRPSYTAHPKSTIHCARPRTYFQNQAQSTVHRPFYKRTALTKRARGVNAVKTQRVSLETIKPNVHHLVFNKYNYIVARGRSHALLIVACSRHLTGNIADLSDSKDLKEVDIPQQNGSVAERKNMTLMRLLETILLFKQEGHGQTYLLVKLGFLSVIYEGKSHQDLHICLFACFLSQEEPKRVSKALSDLAWVEAMREELLQFKLQRSGFLVDLHKGFEDPDHPDKVYKVVKALYGLHQAQSPWSTEKRKAIFISLLVQDGDDADVDENLYSSMIRYLMYLIASRPDIMFAFMCMCKVSGFSKDIPFLALRDL